MKKIMRKIWIWLVPVVFIMIACNPNNKTAPLSVENDSVAHILHKLRADIAQQRHEKRAESPIKGRDNNKHDTIHINETPINIRTIDVVSMTIHDRDLKDFLYMGINESLKEGRKKNRNYYPESVVLGHLEEDTIVGNFNGEGIDTLYIKPETCGCAIFLRCIHAENDENIKYYLVSKSGRIPKVQLLAHPLMPPRVVNEGDLDGNGTCDVGYMYTWDSSQWRNYRILTFYRGEWRYLIDPQKEYMSTSRMFRLSGHEIAEKGKKKGTIRIHYLPEGMNQSIHDATVKPTFTKIDDNDL